jgi:hypothetical protein
MINPASLRNLRLHGGFIIKEVVLTPKPMIDALGREALAKTIIVGQEFKIFIRSELSPEELSVSLYHEVLEAATVASLQPPASVMDSNEGDFEAQAYEMQKRLGQASAENLNRMLQTFGF